MKNGHGQYLFGEFSPKELVLLSILTSLLSSSMETGTDWGGVPSEILNE